MTRQSFQSELLRKCGIVYGNKIVFMANYRLHSIVQKNPLKTNLIRIAWLSCSDRPITDQVVTRYKFIPSRSKSQETHRGWLVTFCVGSEIKSCKHLPKSYALVNGLNYVVDTQQKKSVLFWNKNVSKWCLQFWHTYTYVDWKVFMLKIICVKHFRGVKFLRFIRSANFYLTFDS